MELILLELHSTTACHSYTAISERLQKKFVRNTDLPGFYIERGKSINRIFIPLCNYLNGA